MQFKLASLTALSIVASLATASPALTSIKQGLATCSADAPYRICCKNPDQNLSENCYELQADGSGDDECFDTVTCCEIFNPRDHGVGLICVQPASN